MIQITIIPKLKAFLEEKKLLDEFIYNCLNHAELWVGGTVEIEDIDTAFYWNKTIKGDKFWLKLSDEFNDL